MPWKEETPVRVLPLLLPSPSVPICKLGLYLPLQGCSEEPRAYRAFRGDVIIPDLTPGGSFLITLQGFDSGFVKLYDDETTTSHFTFSLFPGPRTQSSPPPAPTILTSDLVACVCHCFTQDSVPRHPSSDCLTT